MKKITIILVLILGQFLCSSVQAQIESVRLDSPTTFVAEENRMFIGDTLFMNGFRVIVEERAHVRFNEIVGEGSIYLYPDSLFLLRGDLPDEVSVYIVAPERPEPPPKMQKG